MVPGATPMPKSSVIGPRYASVGMICITSRTGPIAAANRRLRPAMMPSGIPIKQRDEHRCEHLGQRRHARLPQPERPDRREAEGAEQRQSPAAEDQPEPTRHGDHARPAEAGEQPLEGGDQAADPDPDELEEEERIAVHLDPFAELIERREERVGLVVRQGPLALEHDVQQGGDDDEDQQQQASAGLRLEARREGGGDRGHPAAGTSGDGAQDVGPVDDAEQPAAVGDADRLVASRSPHGGSRG